MTDLDRLYAAIVAHPDDDTPRLMYADELDAQDTVRVTCPTCDGRGGWETGPHSGECPTCDGTGEVVCTANRDRAEFIRVQCDLARTPDPECLHCWEGNGCVYHAVQRRESTLLTAHPEWLPECSVCFGTGSINYGLADGQCGACSGTSRVGTLARGFLYSVTVPTLTTVLFAEDVPCPNAENAMQCSETGAWECCRKCDYTGVIATAGEPTPWAASLPKTVRRVYCNDIDDGLYPVDGDSQRVFTEVGPHMPSGVYALVKSDDVHAGGMWKRFSTAEAARNALAEAVATLIRES